MGRTRCVGSRRRSAGASRSSSTRRRLSSACAFGAECTPDLYVFDGRQKLAYHGQFDDSRPSNGKPVTGRDLRAAIAAIADGQPPSSDQHASIGCNIKWKSAR